MRVMMIRKADADTEAGVMPSEELLAAMQAYNEELHKAGVLVAGEGLKPSSQAARVSFAGGVPTVTDGPFAETKELIAGFTIIEVDSMAEAIDWARRWPALDGNGAAQLELRPIFGMEDFEPCEALEREAQLRAELDNS